MIDLLQASILRDVVPRIYFFVYWRNGRPIDHLFLLHLYM